MNDLDLGIEVYQGHVNYCVTLHVDVGNCYRWRVGSKGLPIGNGVWAIEWSHDQ